MDRRIWQKLLPLESRDLTQQWFNRIHGRKLNARRTKEINAASKQAREYFRNADSSDYSVRPLLAYYGVASLSRALALLLRPKGGEEGLSVGHGLETVDWGFVLSGSPSDGLRSLVDLKVKTCRGLFSDLIRETSNRLSVHVNSSGVDWRLHYDIAEMGDEISLGEVLARLPDLERDYNAQGLDTRYAVVNEMTYSAEKGFRAKVREDPFGSFSDVYGSCGYNISCDGQWCEVTCDAGTFSDNLPLLVHSYINKTFGSIPTLFLAEPFSSKSRYSQIGITYLVAYFLGMLVRYFPTHWISLIQGEKGDAMWPAVNTAQHLVESSYPELVVEMINDILREKE